MRDVRKQESKALVRDDWESGRNTCNFSSYRGVKDGGYKPFQDNAERQNSITMSGMI